MPPTQDKLIIGYDFGTSSVKAAIFDQGGEIIAYEQVSYPTDFPQPGWAEQNPIDWWEAMKLSTRRLLQKSPASKPHIYAIGVSAQMGGTIPMDKSGSPLHNCLICQDTRSAGISKRITHGFPKISGYGLSALVRWLWLTNGAPNLSGKDPVSKMLWFKESLPDIWAETYKFLDVKDYLLYKLCHRFVASADCAHLTWLMNNRHGQRRWSNYLCQKVGVNMELLPEITSSTDIAGSLAPDAAQQLGLSTDTLVVTGCSDVSAAALGSGELADNEIHLHVGTSSWVACHHPKRAVDVGSGTATLCSAGQDNYLLIAAQELGGGCVKWASENLLNLNSSQSRYQDFDRIAADSTAGARGLFFFPWFIGERVPVDNPDLRAGFANLTISHNLADMARAILEGVALNTRWSMPAIQRISGNSDRPVRFLGGGARSDLWCQIFSDVLQRPIIRIQNPEFGGCVGAAMTAAVGAGMFSSLQDSTVMCATERTFSPDKSLASLYDEKFRFFKSYYGSNRSWQKQVNGRSFMR